MMTNDMMLTSMICLSGRLAIVLSGVRLPVKKQVEFQIIQH